VVELFFFYNTVLYIIYFLLGGILFLYTLYYYFFKNKLQNINTNDNLYNIIKQTLIGSLFLSFFLFLFYFYFYFQFLNKNNFYLNGYLLLPQTNLRFFSFFDFSVDFFGLVLLFLSYFVGVLSLLALDNRIFWKNIKYVFSINIFILIVYFYVFSSNILVFFLFYEFLMVPSFLVVYYVSPSRRSIQASLYFLIWTQIGSFLVLIVIAYIISIVGSSDFYDIATYNFSYNQTTTIFLFLFLGFGFKVPIWPFHYWLTKTHVEAPAGFSMYLSGFLVKSALYGFYKITNIIGGDINTTIFITICLVGIFDSSLKMWAQTDLKKLVAYGTIQEMNLIYLTFCWGDSNAILGGILFSTTHGFLSALMFFLVDCIQRRFNSRSVVEIAGILQLTPMLGISTIIMCVIYAGLPGTLKFTCEFYIFCGLYEISPILTISLFLVANVFGLIGFSKCWYNSVFGICIKKFKTNILDLNYKELYIIYIPIIFLFLIPIFSNILY
jgi:NADH-quinone oxidoreductase subunit M